MKQIVICVILLLSILLWLILDNLNSFYINAEFKELKPLPPIIIVHYKGIKVGRVVSSKHSTDFEHTILRIKLHPKKLNLPANSIAKLMIEKRKFYHYDYIEIIKPEEASKDRLKQNDTIKGVSTIDAKNFLANQDKETLEQIKTKVTARPMPIPLDAVVVKAKVGQVPNTNLREGLSKIKPFEAIFFNFIIVFLLTFQQI